MTSPLFDVDVIYPHCKHCCWGDGHPAIHTTPCWTGCSGEVPVGGAA